MGFFDTLFGNDAADAAKKAAADTYAKQQGAVQKLLGYGDEYADNFAPWRATGEGANAAVANLLADPNSVRSLPGYQTGVQEGTRAIDHSAVSRSGLMNGKLIKDQTRFGENYFDKSYGDQLSRLMGVSQQGLAATGAAEGGRLGARTTAYGGDIGSAGTIGQGDIAAANAKSSALQNLLGTAAYLGGSFLGGGGGMSSFGKLFGGGSSSSYNNPFGGVPNPTFGR